MQARAQHIKLALVALVALVVVVLVAAGCSSPDLVQPIPPLSDQPASDTPPSLDTAENDDQDAATSATGALRQTLADEDITAVIDFQAGVQAQDAQGNLISVYGYTLWPEPFAALSNNAQAIFPFFGEADSLSDPNTQLLALDVGMCSAGIDAAGFGTAEFFVHASADEVLSTDRVLNRGVLTRHPVVTPGFDFPSSATCTRGWLPVLWSGETDPSTARYVLTTRESAADEIERYVYQWDLGSPSDQVTSAENTDGAEDTNGVEDTRFSPGQLVTFHEGVLSATTVTLRGWAELIGTESPIEGTRMVGVSLNWCPSAAAQTEFGLGIDGWNVASPLVTDRPATDDGCSDEWLEFAVPFGGVPTSFFVSDGVSATTGYAEWSLENAALPAPQ